LLVVLDFLFAFFVEKKAGVAEIVARSFQCVCKADSVFQTQIRSLSKVRTGRVSRVSKKNDSVLYIKPIRHGDMLIPGESELVERVDGVEDRRGIRTGVMDFVSPPLEP
jgi:hypothetical protein